MMESGRVCSQTATLCLLQPGLQLNHSLKIKKNEEGWRDLYTHGFPIITHEKTSCDSFGHIMFFTSRKEKSCPDITSGIRIAHKAKYTALARGENHFIIGEKQYLKQVSTFLTFLQYPTPWSVFISVILLHIHFLSRTKQSPKSGEE